MPDQRPEVPGTCRACHHAAHQPNGPLDTRACANPDCKCLRINDATGALLPPTPHVESADKYLRAEVNR